jgi:hypothetical protein
VGFASHLWRSRGVQEDELADDALTADVGSR